MMAAQRLSDELRYNEPMSRHTSWRVGGPADTWFRPESVESLSAFMADLDPATPVHWLGLGSNLLVRDGGVRGVVITVSAALGEITDLEPGHVEAGAGVPCTILARHCVRQGWGPAEFFAGIPGTVGGALRMNAGAFGGETWSVVEEVQVMDRAGAVRWRTADEYSVSYREIAGPEDEWFLAARLRFTTGFDTSMESMRALVKERKEKQPLGLPSCGSVFRNPPGDFSARLIESIGLKGHRIGGAEVSPKHANFIINTGAATAADIEALIAHVRTQVREQCGVELIPEVHIIGEAEESA